MAVLQKYLGWVQRFLFQVESQQPQFESSNVVVPVLEIGQDYPLDFSIIAPANVATIAGTVTVPLFSTNPEQHAWITNLTVNKVAAGTWAAGEQGSLILTVNGKATVLSQWLSIQGLDIIPLIGSQVGFATVLNFLWNGLPSQYIPPNSALTWNHTSTAGGENIQTLGFAVLRPKSYPLQLP